MLAYLTKVQLGFPNLIFYDDQNIDCSDIPEITEKDKETGKIQWLEISEFPMDDEIRN